MLFGYPNFEETRKKKFLSIDYDETILAMLQKLLGSFLEYWKSQNQRLAKIKYSKIPKHKKNIKKPLKEELRICNLILMIWCIESDENVEISKI